MKKKILVMMVLILMFNVVTVPEKKVSANPAIGGVAAGGAATYVYTALALATAYGVSQIDPEAAEAIKAHALQVYNGFNDTVKSAWDAAVASMTPELDTDWSKYKIPAEFIGALSGTTTVAKNINVTTTRTWSSLKFEYGQYRAWFDDMVSDTLKLTFISMTEQNINSRYVITNIYVSFKNTVTGNSTSGYLYNRSTGKVYPGFESMASGLTYDTVTSSYSLKQIISAGLALYFAMNPVIATNVPTDIAINVPASVATPAVDANGEPVKIPIPPFGWGQTSEGDPSSIIVDDSGNPIIDTSNPAVNPPMTVPGEGTAPGTTTGSYTGVLSSILTGVTSLVTALTTGLIGNPADIDWSKLKLAGSAFTTKFPFSIPWDVGRAFDSIFGNFDTSNPPQWTFKITALGKLHTWTVSIPQMLLDWFPVTRAMILIMFDIGLVFAVRKMLGGAQ